jgi:hypothetical protein
MSDAGHSIQFLLHWLGLISGFWLMLLYPVVVEVVHFLIIFSSSICDRSRLCLFLGLLVLWLPLTAHIVILLLWRMYAPVNNCNLIGSLWRSPFDLQLIFNIGCSFPLCKQPYTPLILCLYTVEGRVRPTVPSVLVPSNFYLFFGGKIMSLDSERIYFKLLLYFNTWAQQPKWCDF